MKVVVAFVESYLHLNVRWLEFD